MRRWRSWTGVIERSESIQKSDTLCTEFDSHFPSAGDGIWREIHRRSSRADCCILPDNCVRVTELTDQVGVAPRLPRIFASRSRAIADSCARLAVLRDQRPSSPEFHGPGPRLSSSVTMAIAALVRSAGSSSINRPSSPDMTRPRIPCPRGSQSRREGRARLGATEAPRAAAAWSHTASLVFFRTSTARRSGTGSRSETSAMSVRAAERSLGPLTFNRPRGRGQSNGPVLVASRYDEVTPPGQCHTPPASWLPRLEPETI